MGIFFKTKKPCKGNRSDRNMIRQMKRELNLIDIRQNVMDVDKYVLVSNVQNWRSLLSAIFVKAGVHYQLKIVEYNRWCKKDTAYITISKDDFLLLYKYLLSF